MKPAPQGWVILNPRNDSLINPQEYLTDVLQRLPSTTTSQVRDLLPDRWKLHQAQTATAA